MQASRAMCEQPARRGGVVSMFDPVGSTSWPGRHHRVFARLGELLADEPREPTIIIVGPGAATRVLYRLLADASAGPGTGWRRYATDLARYADHVLRRVPFLPLISFEPLEVSRALGRPHKLIVIDRSQRVLAAVRRDLPSATCMTVDIAAGTIQEQADVVIAFNVVSRIDDGRRAMQCLAAAVRPGGLLLIDDRSAGRWLAEFPQFVPVAEKTYRRAGER